MKELIQKYYHKIVPERWRWALTRALGNRKYKAIRKEAAAYLLQSEDPEMRSVGGFLSGRLEMFPYDYVNAYDPGNIVVHKDETCGMDYVLVQGKRLYAKRGTLPSKIKTMINSLLAEQDPKSPHVYMDAGFDMKQGAVLYDVGGAEGIFTLLNIDKINKAFVFETEESWIEALQHTFAPWKDKVTIINKFVGKDDSADGKFISLDSFARQHPAPDFVKADIEGAEMDMLAGATGLLSAEHPAKWAVCTYHFHEDAAHIDEVFHARGFHTAFTQGYMFCYSVPLKPPYVRRAVLRAEKNDTQ